jgi:hypothetical protein
MTFLRYLMSQHLLWIFDVYVDKIKLIDRIRQIKNDLIVREGEFQDATQTFLEPYVTLVQSSEDCKTLLNIEVAIRLSCSMSAFTRIHQLVTLLKRRKQSILYLVAWIQKREPGSGGEGLIS